MGVFLSVPLLIATRMTCERYEGLMPLAMILGAELPGNSAATAPAVNAKEVPASSVGGPG